MQKEIYQVVQPKRDQRVVVLLTAAELEFIKQKSGQAPADYLRQLGLHYSGFDDEVRRHLYTISQIVHTHVGAIAAAYQDSAPPSLIDELLEVVSAATALQGQVLLGEAPTDIEDFLQSRLLAARHLAALGETPCS
ncbi:hypothetical protein C7271_01485 [filamentous cyanobacterium CCP5]|nr:hypothetical protein C7271_01485 [filamentous cyanobacterium CCP5]